MERGAGEEAGREEEDAGPGWEPPPPPGILGLAWRGHAGIIKNILWWCNTTHIYL